MTEFTTQFAWGLGFLFVGRCDANQATNTMQPTRLSSPCSVARQMRAASATTYQRATGHDDATGLWLAMATTAGTLAAAVSVLRCLRCGRDNS